MLYVVRREDPFPDDFETRNIKGGRVTFCSGLNDGGRTRIVPTVSLGIILVPRSVHSARSVLKATRGILAPVRRCFSPVQF